MKGICEVHQSEFEKQEKDALCMDMKGILPAAHQWVSPEGVGSQLAVYQFPPRLKHFVLQEAP